MSSTRAPRSPFLFFSVSAPPPRATLFPYTTLFRSRIESGRAPLKLEPVKAADIINSAVAPLLMIDRKSTRLNSSRVKMSYAVFCLKKKIADQGVEAACPLGEVGLLRHPAHAHSEQH